MKLSELEARFVRIVEGGFRDVDSIAEAQGVSFLCPGCFVKNNGTIGTHAIICWSRSRGVPDSQVPGPGRWSLNGTGLADLTLLGDGGNNSVKTPCAHFYVTNGETVPA